MNAKEADRLARRLAGYGLGVGAVAAGIALPEKADADFVYEGFSGITVQCEGDVLYVQFSGGVFLGAGTSSCWGPGFNFQYCNCGFNFMGDSGFYGYSMLAVVSCACAYGAMTWSAADTTFNLANVDTNYYSWVDSSFYSTFLPFGTPTMVGLRMGITGSNYYGWVEFERGSLSATESAFNREDSGGMFPGQVPEPSSLLLMLSGAAGLTALRRRRSSAEPE